MISSMEMLQETLTKRQDQLLEEQRNGSSSSQAPSEYKRVTSRHPYRAKAEDTAFAGNPRTIPWAKSCG